MKKSKKRLEVEYCSYRRQTAWVEARQTKQFSEINSSTEYFRIMELCAFEIELQLRFLKTNGHRVDLWMLKNTFEIYHGIKNFKSYNVDVLDVDKDSRPFHLYSNVVFNTLNLNLYISQNNLYEKFFYFRFFETKYFVN